MKDFRRLTYILFILIEKENESLKSEAIQIIKDMSKTYHINLKKKLLCKDSMKKLFIKFLKNEKGYINILPEIYYKLKN